MNVRVRNKKEEEKSKLHVFMVMGFMIALLVLLSGQSVSDTLKWTLLWETNFYTSSMFIVMGIHDCFIGPSLRSINK